MDYLDGLYLALVGVQTLILHGPLCLFLFQVYLSVLKPLGSTDSVWSVYPCHLSIQQEEEKKHDSYSSVFKYRTCNVLIVSDQRWH